mgnify:CR=1 FL=1
MPFFVPAKTRPQLSNPTSVKVAGGPRIDHRIAKSVGFDAGFGPVSEAAIEVDMIVVNAPRDGRVDLSFTVHRDDYPKALELTRRAAARYAGAAVAGDDRVAKLAVVGSGMRSHAGVAAKLFETLGAEGINVRLVSTSEIKISVLVAEKDLERAVRALHKAYGLERPASP